MWSVKKLLSPADFWLYFSFLFYFFSSLRNNWQLGIEIVQCDDLISVYCEMITTIRFVNTSITSHHRFCCLYAWCIPPSFICLIYWITKDPSGLDSGVSAYLEVFLLSPNSWEVALSVHLYYLVLSCRVHIESYCFPSLTSSWLKKKG